MAVDPWRVVDFALALQATTSLGELVTETARAVEAATGYHHVWLFVAEDLAVTHVRLIDAHGAIRARAWETAPILTITGDAMLEELVRAEAAVVVVDARTDPRTDKAIVEALGNRTIVNQPLRCPGLPFAAIGAGTFGDEGVRVPDADQLAFLAAIAPQLCAAIHRIRSVAAEVHAALRASDARFYQVIGSAHEGYIEMDHEGRIVEWNPAAEAMFGWSRAEATERRVVDTIVPPTQREAHSRGLARHGASGESTMLGRLIETEGLHRDGSPVPIELTVTAIGSRDAPRYVALVRDTTARHKAAAALARAKDDAEQAMREYEAFSYSVAHDLRAPLRAIDAYTQTIGEDHGDALGPAGLELVDRAHRNVLKMAELIDNLLRLARVTRADLRRERVDLSRIARALAAQLAAEAPERDVEVVIAPDLVATGDPRLLEIALTNLLDNAWKFTGRRDRARIELGCTAGDGQLVYFVRDNGAGFDMAHNDKLFGVFQRLHAVTEFAGTGIGLATVQRIIRRHGGQVWAEGEVDRGATFYFTLGR